MDRSEHNRGSFSGKIGFVFSAPVHRSTWAISVASPTIVADAGYILVSRAISLERIAQEVTLNGSPFRRRKVFDTMIRFVCPFFAVMILTSFIVNAFGWISM